MLKDDSVFFFFLRKDDSVKRGKKIKSEKKILDRIKPNNNKKEISSKFAFLLTWVKLTFILPLTKPKIWVINTTYRCKNMALPWVYHIQIIHFTTNNFEAFYPMRPPSHKNSLLKHLWNHHNFISWKASNPHHGYE